MGGGLDISSLMIRSQISVRSRYLPFLVLGCVFFYFFIFCIGYGYG